MIISGGPIPSPDASEFNEDVYDAHKRGAIDRQGWALIAREGLVVRGENRETGETFYVFAKSAWDIDEDVVSRARRGADVVARVYPDAKTEAVAFGMTINDRGRDAAERLGVHVYDSVMD